MERDEARSSTGKKARKPTSSSRQDCSRLFLLDNIAVTEHRTVGFSGAAGPKVTRKPQAARYIGLNRSGREADQRQE
ncbi:MAG: hypothetical protein ABIR54_01690 [Burkholderiaceae bacterium]